MNHLKQISIFLCGFMFGIIFFLLLTYNAHPYTIPKSQCEFRTFEIKEFNKKNRQLVAKINRCAWYDMNLKTNYYIPNDFETKWSPLPKEISYNKKFVLYIKLSEFAVGFYDEGILIDWCNMLAGPTTPIGIFTPKRFDKDHESGKYRMPDGRPAPMPNAINITGAYWVHGGDVIAGEHLSHGCVNIPNYFMEWVFYMALDYPNDFLIVVVK